MWVAYVCMCGGGERRARRGEAAPLRARRTELARDLGVISGHHHLAPFVEGDGGGDVGRAEEELRGERGG